MFALREALINIRRNLVISSITFITIFISYIIGALVVVITSQINTIGKYWDINTVNVYLCNDQVVDQPCNGIGITDQQRDEISNFLKKNNQVKNFKYEDATTAYERFVKQYKNSDITKVVLPNQMQASYRVHLKQKGKEDTHNLIVNLKKMQGVSDAIDSKQTIGKSIHLLNNIRKIAFLATFIISIFSIFLMINIIQLSATTKSEEMKIMKLIGAYPSTIKFPFILQNLILTFSASLLSSISLYLLYNSLIKRFFAESIIAYSLDRTSFLSNLLLLIVIYSIISALIGYFTINKYTKV